MNSPNGYDEEADMTSSRKIILFEINEIPYRIFDYYTQRHPGSHLATLMQRAKQFETVCEDQVELDPWISWPTLHRGVIDEQHRILHLGQSLDAANRSYPSVWELLSTQGKTVGVMGSLHSSTPPADMSNYVFYVPDFFAHETFAHPQELTAFQKFNLAMTRQSARNVNRSIPVKETASFLAHYARHGMSAATVRAALSVLAGEIRKPHLRCRRRAIQPLITLDLFMHMMKTSRPDFATVHTNHVAAAMHRYWAATFPQDADNSMPDEWRAKYGNEIDYSMQILDAMVGRLKAFCDQDDSYILVCASSMGQAAIRTKVSKRFATVTDLKRFMKRLGVPESQWSQRFAMVPCISVVVAPDSADAFEQRLQSLRVGDRRIVRGEREVAPMSYDRKDNTFQLFVYFEGLDVHNTCLLGDEVVPFADIGFGGHVHQDDVACSARHIPQGALIVYDPRNPAVDQGRSEISTLDVAPAILQAFGVPVPDYMNLPDRDILDTTSIGSSVRVSVSGGGVEVPVIRHPQHAVQRPAPAEMVHG